VMDHNFAGPARSSSARAISRNSPEIDWSALRLPT